MYPNLPHTAFWVLGLFVLACCKFILEKVDNLRSFLNFIHYFWVVVQQAHQFGAMAGFGAFLESLFFNQSFVYICKM
jgi:hypothetical protein